MIFDQNLMMFYFLSRIFQTKYIFKNTQSIRIIILWLRGFIDCTHSILLNGLFDQLKWEATIQTLSDIKSNDFE